MAILVITKDRLTDNEVIIVSCTLDDVNIKENYFYDVIKTDGEIDTEVRTDLTTKGYIFE